MKCIPHSLLLIGGFCVLTVAHAHDPSQHKEKSEKPDCAAFEKMDHSKMDPNDPVMQAMMKKCQDTTHDHHAPSKDGSADPEKHDHPAEKNPQSSGHAH